MKEEAQKVENLQEQNRHLLEELKEKEQIEQTLIKKCESLNKNTSRYKKRQCMVACLQSFAFLGQHIQDES